VTSPLEKLSQRTGEKLLLAAACQKLTREQRIARRVVGTKRWQRRVCARISELFEVMDADDRRGCHDPAEVAARYHHTYGQRLPLLYARAHTEFGERFGVKTSWEDIAGGSYTPHSEGRSIEEQIEEHERWLVEQEAPRCPVCEVAPVKMRGAGAHFSKTCGAAACKLVHQTKQKKISAALWRKNNVEHVRAQTRLLTAKRKKQREQAKLEKKLAQRRGGFGIPFGEPVVSYGRKNSYDSYVVFAVERGVSPMTEERWRLLAA
jgi:hypothetical protein